MAMSDQKRAAIAGERRQQILTASLKLFDERGFRETTIQDIADEAGISKGLIYRYFDSKEHILEGHAELIEKCERECAEVTPAADALRLYATRLLGDAALTGYHPPLRVYIVCYIKGDLSEAMISRYIRSCHGREVFGPVITRGQKNGEFREGDADEMADIFWHYLLGRTATLVSNPPCTYTLPDIEQMIALLKA